MNHYSELLGYIKQLGEADPFVNTITQGDFEDVDLDKYNLYPLLHIQINGGNLNNGQAITLSVQIGCLQQRSSVNEKPDKFWDNDNEVDNLNETLAVLNRLWLIMYRDFDRNNITASENPPLEPMINAYDNGLDGWALTFDVTMPNTVINLCR